jgi:1-acyl-sn-glycerol-3-phosphate acyltransferase
MKRLFSIYAWTVAGLFFIIIMIISILFLSFIPSKKFHPVFRSCMRFLFSLLFVRVKREYLQPLDFNERCIYMPNHVSLLDAPLCSAYMPEFITALEAIEHFRWPIYGRLTKLYGNIPIDRKSPQNSIKTLQIAKNTLEKSNSMVIFPEGSRTEDGTIGRFKKMPFQLAKDAGVAIVPVGVSGAYKLNPKHSMILRPSKVKIKFGAPIPAEKVAKMNIDELVESVRNQVLSLHEYN